MKVVPENRNSVTFEKNMFEMNAELKKINFATNLFGITGFCGFVLRPVF
jgi:hypothetical protein